MLWYSAGFSIYTHTHRERHSYVQIGCIQCTMYMTFLLMQLKANQSTENKLIKKNNNNNINSKHFALMLIRMHFLWLLLFLFQFFDHKSHSIRFELDIMPTDTKIQFNIKAVIPIQMAFQKCIDRSFVSLKI